jgi:hypothetical protein
VLRDTLAHVDAREPLLLLKAPPGSGKTHVLVRAAVLAAHRGARVAVATQTSAQADDFCRRTAADFPGIALHRFAASDALDADLGASVRAVRAERELPRQAGVVVATAAKWAMLRESPGYDFTLVDEAWQMKWADLTLLSRVAPRYVLIGDPGQIEPTVTVDTQRWETAPRAPHRAAPEIVLEDPSLPRVVRELPVSTRLPHDTVELVRCFYDFRFDSWTEPGERRLIVSPSGAERGVDAAIDRLRGGTVAALTLPTPEPGPPEEDGELVATVARTVRRLLERGARACTEHGERPLTAADIGVTATHRLTNARLTEALGGLAAEVRVDTPERWQGLEREVMIGVHPLSGVTEPSPFDLSTGRLCVMTSRHSVGLILVTRDHVGATLARHLPAADQPVGRPDATGRGHARHRAVWRWLEDGDRLVRA